MFRLSTVVTVSAAAVVIGPIGVSSHNATRAHSTVQITATPHPSLRVLSTASATAPACHTALLSARRLASSSASSRKPNKTRTVDHYRRLGVEYDATAAEVKAAYRTRALECHPDVVEPHKRGEAEVLFRGCSESFEILFNPATRRQHDIEIGVEEIRRRRQQARMRRDSRDATATATGASSSSSSSATASYRASSFGSSFARDAHNMETEEEKAYYSRAQAQAQAQARHGRQQATTAHDGEADTEDSTSGPVGAAPTRKKPFVRGDADRVFRDAFEGKSLDQILFDAQRRRRQQAASSAASQAVAAARASSTASAEAEKAATNTAAGATPAGREEVLRRAMELASERYARRVERQYGHGMLKHFHAQRAPWDAAAEGPAAPPSSHMPFRPFVNTVVPEGVSTPDTPVLGPLGSTTDGSVDPEDIELTAEHDKAVTAELERLEAALRDATAQGNTVITAELKKRLAARRKEIGLMQFELADGTLLSPGDSLTRATKRVQGAAHNMGQLYSYHRPY